MITSSYNMFNKNFDSKMIIRILTTTIKFVKDCEKFDQPLF